MVARLVVDIGLVTRRAVYGQENETVLPNKENKLFIEACEACVEGWIYHRGEKSVRDKIGALVGAGKSKRLDAMADSLLKPDNIEMIGLWDTVASVGNPRIGPFIKQSHKYAWVEQLQPGKVEYAYQLLAAAERRGAFEPVLFLTGAATKETVQTWFPGTHSGTGGGLTQDGTVVPLIGFVWMCAKILKHDLFGLDMAMVESICERPLKIDESLKSSFNIKDGSFLGELYRDGFVGTGIGEVKHVAVNNLEHWTGHTVALPEVARTLHNVEGRKLKEEALTDWEEKAMDWLRPGGTKANPRTEKGLPNKERSWHLKNANVKTDFLEGKLMTDLGTGVAGPSEPKKKGSIFRKG
jgi:hypothetical protein